MGTLSSKPTLLNQPKEIVMSRPEGTKHTCPEGYTLIEKSIDPDYEPVLEDGEILLIKAGNKHYTGTYGGGKDISHYDICFQPPASTTTTAPPVTTTQPPPTTSTTAPPVTTTTSTPPPTTVPETTTTTSPEVTTTTGVDSTTSTVPESTTSTQVTFTIPTTPTSIYTTTTTESPVCEAACGELPHTGANADIAGIGGLVLGAGVLLTVIAKRLKKF